MDRADWHQRYDRIKPVMGGPDDTAAGHASAEASARLAAARDAMRWYQRGQISLGVLMRYLSEALN